MKNEPLVSVVMPVFNASIYVEDAIRSILNQTFENFELIILDDGSTDSSDLIIKRMAKYDPRIHTVFRGKKGLAIQRNFGIELSRGRFVAVMDADDISHPDRLRKQLDFMDANPEIVAVGGQVALIDPDGRSIGRFHLPTKHEEIDRAHLKIGSMAICHPSALIRASALEAVGNYREKFKLAQDYDLWLRLAEIGKLANVSDILLDYRQHLESISYEKRGAQTQFAVEAVEDALKRRNIVAIHSVPDGLINQQSKADVERKWAWWALNGGHLSSARFYARKTVSNSPFDRESWRLLYCAYRG